MPDISLSGLAARVLSQDVDLAFGFEAEALPGQFVVREFSATEEVFECYGVAIELASEEVDLDLTALVDTPAVLSILYVPPDNLDGMS